MSRTWNFASRPFRDNRPVYVATAALFTLGAVVLVLNLRLVGEYRGGVAATRGAIAALEKRGRLADEKANAAKAALSSYRLSALADESRGLARIAAERRFSWTTLLTRLERTLPGQIGVTRLQPQFSATGEVVLDMELIARGREAIVPTIVALSKDPAFQEIELRSETTGEPGAVDPFVFQLQTKYFAEAGR